MESPQTQQPSVLRSLSNQMADAVAGINPAVLLVDGRERQPASGVVYGENLVLTAAHVVERTDKLSIQTHDGRTLPAELVGKDATTDLALLRVPDLALTAPTLTQEQARVGQLVLALGRTNDEGVMASVGIVSTIGGPLRTEYGTVLESYIRTDAIPYPGFSGGPLVDTQGHLVGILTTGLLNGLAVTIPIQIAHTIANTLATQGHIKRGYLGISSQLVHIPAVQRAERQEEHGLLLLKVDEQSPAQAGGLLLGDILITLDGHTIKDAEDLQLLLTGERIGKQVPVEVIRGNTVVTLTITIGQRP